MIDTVAQVIVIGVCLVLGFWTWRVESKIAVLEEEIARLKMRRVF